MGSGKLKERKDTSLQTPALTQEFMKNQHNNNAPEATSLVFKIFVMLLHRAHSDI